jgi:hypothetical protein
MLAWALVFLKGKTGEEAAAKKFKAQATILIRSREVKIWNLLLEPGPLRGPKHGPLRGLKWVPIARNSPGLDRGQILGMPSLISVAC